MSGEMFELVFDFFFGDIDIFRGGDAIDDELGLDVILGAVFIAFSERDPVDIYGPGVDALLRQRANYPFEPHIHLMLDERLGYREVVELDDFGQDLFAEQVFVLVVALMLEAFADFLFQLVEGGGVADVFSEIVVEVGEFLGLDAQDIDRIMIGVAGELGVGIIGGIGDVEILVVADIYAAKIFVEGRHGFFGADVAENAVGLERFAAAFWSAGEFQLDEVPVCDRASFRGSEGGGAFAHFFESFGDVLV